MKILNLLLVTLFSILLIAQTSFGASCQSDADCNNGKCNTNICVCLTGYVTFKNDTCNYKQKEKLTTFLLSFIVGGLGVDWFYLAEGNSGYIAAGVFKLLTGGGFGIWYMVDWIRVLADAFKDGNGVALKSW